MQVENIVIKFCNTINKDVEIYEQYTVEAVKGCCAINSDLVLWRCSESDRCSEEVCQMSP